MTSNLYAIGFVVSLLAGAAGLYYLFSGMAASPESAEELDLQQPEAVTAESSTSSGGGRKPFESTHYAWAKDVRKREAELRSLGVDYSPKPIHIAAAPAVVSSTKAGSTSAWNSAGTWEDRDVTTKARQLMEGALGAVVVQLAADSTLRVGNVTRNSGTATLAFVRGQTRPGYEWSVSVEFRIVEGIADADEHAHDTHGRQLAAGTLHLDGISDTESDCFDRLRIEIANSERDASKLRSEISKIATPALRDAIRSWAKALTVA